jgi:phosphate/sulfate permease
MNLFALSSYAVIFGVFLLMFISFLVGSYTYRWLKKRRNVDGESTFGAVQGSLLGLLALLLSFTFSMSNSNYDRRVDAIRDEANAIGTAVLRADLYPDSIRQAYRKDLKEYLETRIEFYEAKTDMKRINESLKARQLIQESLWARASSIAREPAFLMPNNQMVPALNAMFDAVTTRNLALLKRVPEIILWVLILLCATSAFTLGYSQGGKSDWIMNIGFAIMICLALYLVIDLDRSRRGVINTEFANQEIKNLRTMFSNPD